MARVRALIADFGGVLTGDFFEVLRSFARRESLPENALVEAVTINPVGKSLLAALERGDLTQPEFETKMAPLLGVPEEGLLARITADLAPDEAMVDATRRLRAAGTPCAVLSNSWGLAPHNPYASWELERNWDVVIYSEQVAMRKPAPQIYQLAADRLGVPASQCVFIDDLAHNLPPRRRTRHDRHPPPGQRAHYSAPGRDVPPAARLTATRGLDRPRMLPLPCCCIYVTLVA